MKIKLLLSAFCLLSFLNIYSNDQYDAEYIIHETKEIFSKEKNKQLYVFVREVEVHRKIRIHSLSGLERFNRLYIPTYEDLNFKSVVYELSARTIKKSGNEIELDISEIKETTLPGNNAYIRNYEGSVKLLAFPQVDVGDIVEYTYKVRYINDVSKRHADDFEFVIQKDIPVNIYNHEITLKEGMFVNIIENNVDGSYHETKEGSDVNFKWEFANVKPYNLESYSHEYDYLSSVSLLISTFELNFQDSWQDIMDQIDRIPKKKFRFVSDYSIRDMMKLASDFEQVEQKVRLICDSLYKYSDEVDSYDFFTMTGSQFWNANWFRNNKYLRLFKQIGIEASLIKVRSKSQGPFDEDLLTLAQFDVSLIEFVDENGKKHYLFPSKRSYPVDYIPFEFQGAMAVRLKDLLHDSSLEVFTIPYHSSDMMTSKEERTITIHYDRDSLFYELDVTQDFKGNPDYNQIGHVMEWEDTLVNKIVESALDFELYNRTSIEVYDSSWESKVNDYYTGDVTLSGVIKSKEKMRSNQESIALWQLLNLGQFNNWLDNHKLNQTRHTDVHLRSAYKASTSMFISTVGDYQLGINEFMNVDFSNEYGRIVCEINRVDEILKISLELELKKGFAPKDDWNELVKFDKEFQDLLYLELPLTK